MSCILYYSKYCEICKEYLKIISKYQLQNDIHFICIDRRINENNNTYIILENGQKIILPQNVVKVPALLLLNANYKILYGQELLDFLRPKQIEEIRESTFNNMEPMSYSFDSVNSICSNVVSDNFSYLDQGEEELKATGNGGMRQMHNYVDFNNSSLNLNNSMNMNFNNDYNTTLRGSKKMGEENSNTIMEARLKKMQEERDADIKTITNSRPPLSY